MSFRKPYTVCVLLILSAGTGRSHLCFHCSLNTKGLSCFRKAEGDSSFTFICELFPKGAVSVFLTSVSQGLAQSSVPK